jgi:AP-1 complex subunit beta-1
MAGQQAENLLDFDDEPSPAPGASTINRPTNDRGLISNQQISSAAKSTNPLDELMDLFSTANMATPSQAPGASAVGSGGGMGGLGMDLMEPPSSSQSPVGGQSQGQGQGQKKGDDDLLGLF